MINKYTRILFTITQELHSQGVIRTILKERVKVSFPPLKTLKQLFLPKIRAFFLVVKELKLVQ